MKYPQTGQKLAAYAFIIGILWYTLGWVIVGEEIHRASGLVIFALFISGAILSGLWDAFSKRRRRTKE